MLTKSFQDLQFFRKRRERLNKLAPDSTFVFFSGKESHLSRFRAKSSFVYFTGFEEPDSAVVLNTGTHPSFHLFVREKNPDIEIWDGERFGLEKAHAEFGADQTHSIEDFADRLPELMRGSQKLFYSLGDEPEYDEWVLEGRRTSQQLDRRSGSAMAAIEDPRLIVNQMRVIKDDLEIDLIQKACQLSARAHQYVMERVSPGMNERQVQGLLFHSFYDQMADREGYSSIIASGPNACTLHYRANSRTMEDGDFLLIDAGAEKSYYTADITRTYPVGGSFSQPQKELYQAVLDAQKELIEKAGPGSSLMELHDLSCRLLTRKMMDLKLLSGTLDENIESGAYRKYYPHGMGHYLGMDVHDVGLSKDNNKPVPLQPGMIHTIEPGLYVPFDDESAPKDLRGLGVRIEDDILITKSGNQVLTESAPKEIVALEQIVGSKAKESIA